MEIRNCPKCKQIFTYVSTPLCPKCEKEEENTYNNVRDYIKENPMCSLGEVTEHTGVSAKRIMKYIKEGRLEISKGMHGILECEQCGKPIIKGKYCDSCVIKINQDVASMFSKSKPAAKMHTMSDRDIGRKR